MCRHAKHEEVSNTKDESMTIAKNLCRCGHTQRSHRDNKICLFYCGCEKYVLSESIIVS